ncbi:Histone H1.2 [Fagus crenata]
MEKRILEIPVWHQLVHEQHTASLMVRRETQYGPTPRLAKARFNSKLGELKRGERQSNNSTEREKRAEQAGHSEVHRLSVLGPPPTHSALLTHHLKRLKNSGLLIMVKKSYKLPRFDASFSLPTLPHYGHVSF